MKKELIPSALRATTLATLVSIALLAACSDKQAENKPVSDNSGTPAATSAATSTTTPSPADNKPEPEANKEADASSKVQAYIQCYNSADKRGHDTIERYASWVKDMKAGPTGKERVVYGLYEISESTMQSCQKEIMAAVESQPALEPLDGTARHYLDAFVALADRVNEADKYYDRKDYEDDGFAKGKKMHAPLVQAMENFKAASSAFSDALEVENDKLLAQERDHVEKTEGRKLRYWRMLTMAEAKQLTNIIAEEKFDIDKATAKLAEFEKAADELAAYAKDHKDELPTMWSMMDSSIESFRIAAKERVRRVRDKKSYSQSEIMRLNGSSGWTVDGSAEKLVRQYNELVGRSNSTH